MQINELPNIPQTPADDDVMAIEVNGITYKISKSALANAIISGITPEIIDALPISGGTMTGDIDMGQSAASSTARKLVWKTADGTVFRLRPYNNLMQLTRQMSGTNESNCIGFYSDGSITIGSASNWRSATGIKTGAFLVESTSGGTYTDTEVSFGFTFESTPIVVVGFRTASTAATFGNCSCAVLSGSVSTTGFTARFYNGDTTARVPEITWIAIG